MLEFRFDEFVAEGRLFLSLAEERLTRGQRDKVAGALTALQSYRYSGSLGVHAFTASELETYPTPVSVGQRAGRETVYAWISVVWAIRKSVTRPTERFVVIGEALTYCRPLPLPGSQALADMGVTPFSCYTDDIESSELRGNLDVRWIPRRRCRRRSASARADRSSVYTNASGFAIRCRRIGYRGALAGRME